MSKKANPNPTSPKYKVPPSLINLLAVTQDETVLSRPQRRDQIAQQVEDQINRKISPTKLRRIELRRSGVRSEAIPVGDWQDIRLSSAPRDLVARDEWNRKKGWERGKRDDEFFAKEYRFDHDKLPLLRWKYETPKNSKVSDLAEWRSDDWYRGLTKRRNKESLPEAPAENPKGLAAQKKAAQKATLGRFLGQSLPTMGKEWKGVKVLGKGGQGIVGLWEYQGDKENLWGRRIVVKQSLQESLAEERDMMLAVGADTEDDIHTVKLLYPVVKEEGEGFISQLILEFCEGGDLESLIWNHRKDKQPFSEENLWLFFECFSKGLNLMDHGDQRPARKHYHRDAMCHFDIKPQNILRGKFDSLHSVAPINKIADFGLAAIIDPIHYQYFWRRRGTLGYLAPEQFSGRWAFKDAQSCGHINVFGTHTNVWQIGLLMYSLATLGGPPRPKGFRCAAIGKKFTYGYKLHKAKYSRTLKALIWRCLCDKPEERPDLETIANEIATALDAIKVAPSAAKSNQRLDPAEPQDPKASSKEKAPEMGGQVRPAERENKRKAPDQQLRDTPAKKVPQGKVGDKEGKPRQVGAPTGTRTSPFVLPSRTMVLKRHTFLFCVVPKHLPEAQQEPIWFRATQDSTLEGLKQVIRDETGLNLGFEEQFIYVRVPGNPFRLLEVGAQILSLRGVGQDTRLELWTAKEAHDAAEPQEEEFEVV